MLLGLALFLAGPKIMNKDFIESSHGVFTLEPYGNKTIYIPISSNQESYMSHARNLVLRNAVSVEINGSRPFTVYLRNSSKTEKLAEHTQFYSYDLPNIEIEAELIVENEANETMNVRINITRVLTARIADFTIPHAGFIIFITTLLTLQILSLATNRDTLIGSIIDRVALKLRRKYADAQKTSLEVFNDIILEITALIFLLGVGVCPLIVSYKQGLCRNYASYCFNYLARLILVVILFTYVLATLLRPLNIIINSLRVRILKKKGQEFLEIYEEIIKSHKYIVVKIAFPLMLVILTAWFIVIVIGLEPIITLIVIGLLPLTVYYIVLDAEIKHLRKKLGHDDFNECLASFLEIDAKAIGLYVLDIIVISFAFTMMMYLLSAPTSNMLLSEYYPSFLYELEERRVLNLDKVSTVVGQFLALLCLLLTGCYLITRFRICEFKAEYKSRLFVDMKILLIVFFISEYLNQTYYFFTQKQSYDVARLPISILIGMTASILNDLLTEIQPK